MRSCGSTPTPPRRRSSPPWTTTCAAAALTPGSCRPSSRPPRPWQRGSDMDRHPEIDDAVFIQELDFADRIVRRPLNRRDFLKVSGGILITVALWDESLWAQ